jgi:hypothetical protein
LFNSIAGRQATGQQQASKNFGHEFNPLVIRIAGTQAGNPDG